MAGRLFGFNSPLTTLRAPDLLTKPSQCVRHLHRTVKPAAIPKPTPFVPDTKTFLTLIGRKMSRFAGKFESWDQLFTMSSDDMRIHAGMTFARERRYLIRWREKFRRQDFGVGGDLDTVVNGVAELRTIELPVKLPQTRAQEEAAAAAVAAGETQTQGEEKKLPPVFAGSATLSPGMKWAIVNLAPGQTEPTEPLPYPPKRYKYFKLFNGNMIKGPFVKAVKGSDASVVQVMPVEGMWEHKLGKKIDGGERRRAEVRAKKRIAERRAGSA